MHICVNLVKYGANLRKASKIRCKCAPDKVSSIFRGQNLRSPTLFGDEIYEPFMNWPRILRALRFFAWSFTRCSRIRCVFYALYVDLLRISRAFYGFASYFMGLTWICCVLCDLGPFWNLKPDPHPREAPKHPKMSFLGPFCWMVLATLRNSVGQRKLRDFSKNSDLVCVKLVKHIANLRKTRKTRCKSCKFV